MFFKLSCQFMSYFDSFGEYLENYRKGRFFAVLDSNSEVDGHLYGYTCLNDSFTLLSDWFMHEALAVADHNKEATPFVQIAKYMKVLEECFIEVKASEVADTLARICVPSNLAYWGNIDMAKIRTILEIEKMAEFIPEDQKRLFYAHSGLGKKI